MNKLVVYHHGTVPSEAVAKEIKKLGVKVPCRNALRFDGPEKFDTVVIDQGTNTDRIKAAYEAQKAKVQVLGKDKAPEPQEEKKQEAPFNPDQPRAGGRKPRAQGGTAPEPEKAS